MWKAIKRWWKYLGAKLGLKLEESADPKVQLEQAITEAREQHRKLTEQAANVIANQKQTQLKLDRAMDEYEKANASARQALLLTDQETRAGNADKAASFSSAAEAFANKLINLEKQIDDLKKTLLDATQQSEKAKQMVAQNSSALQKKLAEREKLLSQLDQAKMQEQMSKAMTQLSADGRRRRPDLRPGPRQDREAPLQGAGHQRPHRCDRRHQDARGRAGAGERRGPGPAQRAAHRRSSVSPAPPAHRQGRDEAKPRKPPRSGREPTAGDAARAACALLAVTAAITTGVACHPVTADNGSGQPAPISPSLPAPVGGATAGFIAFGDAGSAESHPAAGCGRDAPVGGHEPPHRRAGRGRRRRLPRWQSGPLRRHARRAVCRDQRTWTTVVGRAWQSRRRGRVRRRTVRVPGLASAAVREVAPRGPVAVPRREQPGRDPGCVARRAAQRARPALRVVVFHQPAYSCALHGSTPAVDTQWAPILEAHHVALVINGHDHYYERFRSAGDVTYVVTGGGGYELYSRQPGCSVPVTSQATASRHHFVGIEIVGSTLTLTAVSRTGDVLDRTTITR